MLDIPKQGRRLFQAFRGAQCTWKAFREHSRQGFSMSMLLTDSIKPSPGVAGVKAYSVPAHGAPIDLKLDANEGESPDARIIESLFETGGEVMRRYPSIKELQQILADHVKVPFENLVVTAGADDALDRLCRAILQPGKRLLLTNPSFEMLPRYARIMGAEIDEVSWWDGPFPVEDFVAQIKDNTAIVAVVSPNNPTGTVATLDELKAISAAAPNAVFLLDHAYVEFADEDLTHEALKLPNMIVVRTLSKAWGLAGLRTGYAIANTELLNWMRASGGPYAVSRPSIALAVARLKQDKDSAEKFLKQVKSDRKRLHDLFNRYNVEHTDSNGNFAFVTSDKAIWLRDALASVGIAIRAYPGHPELGRSLRITCPGDQQEADRLVNALHNALDPTHVIVDETCLSDEEKKAFVELEVEMKDKRTLLLGGHPAVDEPLSERHQSDRIWYVTSRIEDIEKYRKERVICLGYNDDGKKGTKTFCEAGAARMIESIQELKEILT